MSWIAANPATLIVGGLLLLAVVLAIRSLWKTRKSGGCSGSCPGCALSGKCPNCPPK